MNKLRFFTLITSLTILCNATIYCQNQSTNKYIKEITDTTINNVIENTQIVVIDCWAVWCKPCKMMEPEFDAAAKELKKVASFYKLNLDFCPKTAEKYEIISIPDILIFKDGILVHRISGLTQKDRIVEDLKKIVQE